ncbi:STAS domain-containing protein [Nocardioides sp. CER19]|uniref:STAS domain-containing protein n=1 Tax=Nocardioides sp. CER19 TaxID=3038538 RepID=UPI00244909D2|nr:STAS domain-containing protein [Nocardioides sp. CER19]MDH2414920.1 STAS domain-containing protein [Nocardioides sp. CER19]
MELTIATAGSELTPKGSIDLVSRHELVDAGRAVLDEHGALVLNMKGVDFMDSVGVGAVIELAKTASSRGATFALIEPSPPVQRVLAVTGLADAWPLENPTDTV